MRAYKCDRCGKAYDKNPDRGISVIFRNEAPHIGLKAIKDLCPECDAELNNWFHKPNDAKEMSKTYFEYTKEAADRL